MCIVYEAQVNLQVKRIEVTVEASDDAVMPQSDVVNAFTKEKGRGYFAALLVEKLFDEETRVKSNVRGRGKEKLDPTIIVYIRAF